MLGRMKHLLVIAALLVGCSKSGSDCATAIGKGMEKFSEKARSGNPEMQQAMNDVAGKLKDTLIKRCTEDKWPSEVVNCFTTAADRPAMQECQSKLSDDQREKVMADIRSVMMGGMKMPPGMAGHPDGLKGAMDQAKDQAQEAAQQATDSVSQLMQQATDLAKQINDAATAVANAQDAAARSAAQATLDALLKQKVELDAKVNAAKAAPK